MGAGLEGHAVMKDDIDENIYVWDKEWRSLGPEKVKNVGYARGGRLYKVDSLSEKLFE